MVISLVLEINLHWSSPYSKGPVWLVASDTDGHSSDQILCSSASSREMCELPRTFSPTLEVRVTRTI